MERKYTGRRYLDALEKKVLIYDGAMGTSLQNLKLSAEHFGGEQYKGCIDYLVISYPQAVEQVHRSFRDVGVDVIETDTFRANPFTLGEYGLARRCVLEVNRVAAQLAKRLASEYSTPEHPRFVAGSIGPSRRARDRRANGHFQWFELANGDHSLRVQPKWRDPDSGKQLLAVSSHSIPADGLPGRRIRQPGASQQFDCAGQRRADRCGRSRPADGAQGLVIGGPVKARDYQDVPQTTTSLSNIQLLGSWHQVTLTPTTAEGGAGCITGQVGVGIRETTPKGISVDARVLFEGEPRSTARFAVPVVVQ